MTYHKAVELSAYEVSHSRIVAAECEMTRPSDVVPYDAGDTWNDSDTVDPHPFEFAFPLDWANESVYIVRCIVCNNNLNFPSTLIVYLYRQYPLYIPLDNTVMITTVDYYAERLSFVLSLNSITMAGFGASTGKIGATAYTTYPNPFRLDKDSKLYGIVRHNSGYTPLSGEIMYIKLLAFRNPTPL